MKRIGKDCSFVLRQFARRPWLHDAVPLLTMVVALAATIIPARHAAATQPMEVLREG